MQNVRQMTAASTSVEVDDGHAILDEGQVVSLGVVNLHPSRVLLAHPTLQSKRTEIQLRSPRDEQTGLTLGPDSRAVVVH